MAITDILQSLSPQEKQRLFESSLAGGAAAIAPLLGPQRRPVSTAQILAALAGGVGQARAQELQGIQIGRAQDMQTRLAERDLEMKEAEAAKAAEMEEERKRLVAGMTPEMRNLYEASRVLPAEAFKRAFPERPEPKSEIAQLAYDFQNGLMSEDAYKAAVRKATYISPTQGPEAWGQPTPNPDLGPGLWQQSNRGEWKQASSGGAFGGTSLDAQSLNIALAGADRIRQGIPMSPQEQATYEAARMQLMQPKVSIDPVSGTVSTVTPQYDFPPAGGSALPSTGAAPASSPDTTQVAPGVTVTDVGGTRAQRQKADESISAYNDMVVITDKLEKALGTGVDPANRSQVGAVESLLGEFMATIAKAQERGVLQPGEADQIKQTIGDPTSFSSYIRTKTGVFDPIPQLKGFLNQQLSTTGERMRNRASEFGMSQEELSGKMRQRDKGQNVEPQKPRVPPGSPAVQSYDDFLGMP